MRIAAFTRYGARAASTRQRFLQYFPALRQAGIEVDHFPLLDDDYVASLVSGDRYPRARILEAYASRVRQLIARDAHDLYWIYVELLPYLPAAVERALIGAKRVVFDFDDAFFHSYDQSRRPWVRGLLAGKHAALLKDAAACCCGNRYLLDFAARHTSNPVFLPTVVDTGIYVPDRTERSPLTIGWIGSPSTWPNVRPILPLLQDLARSHGARIIAVGAGDAAAADRFQELELIAWEQAREVPDVQAMDIGIMPLRDSPFERGKSGYKLIQYMACGLPVVASPVGANCEIVEPGVNGFLATTTEEWRAALIDLVENPALRRKLGDAGRARVERDYSLAVHAPRLIEVMRSAAA